MHMIKLLHGLKKLGRRKGGMLEALHKLRSVSLHPLDMKAAELSDLEYIQASARLITTFKVLDEIANRNEKVLIFFGIISNARLFGRTNSEKI